MGGNFCLAPTVAQPDYIHYTEDLQYNVDETLATEW